MIRLDSTLRKLQIVLSAVGRLRLEAGRHDFAQPVGHVLRQRWSCRRDRVQDGRGHLRGVQGDPEASVIFVKIDVTALSL